MVVPASADSVSDKQHQAQQIADRIAQLGNRAADLGEALNGAKLALDKAQANVKDAETRLATQEQKLGAMRSSMSAFALKSYVYADQTGGLAGLLAGTSLTEGAAQREGYQAVALGANRDLTDQVKAVIQDTQRERDVLGLRQATAAKLMASYQAAQTQADDALAQQQQLQAKVKGDLVTLVAQEQQRRANADAAAAAAVQTAVVTPTPNSTISKAASSSTTAAKPQNVVARPAPQAPPPVDIPATSPGAAIAVRAALSQVGVAYQFAAASPGVAFDCSGLTMWAWAQAGVSLPHFSRSQWEVLPHVPLNALQPGDLVFFYSDVHHVGIYIGGGQMVHASMPGVGVVVSGLGGGLIGAARP
jgi:cell wall-associated NlpC family hydrolase